MSVTITEKAASGVKKIIADQRLDPATLLRVGVAPDAIEGFIEPRAVSALATGSFATAGVDDIAPWRAQEPGRWLEKE